MREIQTNGLFSFRKYIDLELANHLLSKLFYSVIFFSKINLKNYEAKHIIVLIEEDKIF